MISTKSEHNAKWEDEATAQGLGFLREGGRETGPEQGQTPCKFSGSVHVHMDHSFRGRLKYLQ